MTAPERASAADVARSLTISLRCNGGPSSCQERGAKGLVPDAFFADDERVVDQLRAGRGKTGGIHPLLLTGTAPVLPMLIGSAINIWYNITNIEPLLTPAQRTIFMRTVTLFNLTVYPLLGGIWAWLLLSLLAPFREQSLQVLGPEERLPGPGLRDEQGVVS